VYGWRASLAAVVVATVIGGCGSQKASKPPISDGFGDPYITDAQGHAIRIGESASAAFHALGGKATSGVNGGQAPPPHSYDYPIRGTGNPDDVNDEKTVWWEICIGGDNRVTGKVRTRGLAAATCVHY
jgi:hypothetical protein